MAAEDDDEGDEESRVLFAAPTTPGTSATAAKSHPLVPEDDERRKREQRLRQEEADMDGWESSGELRRSAVFDAPLLTAAGSCALRLSAIFRRILRRDRRGEWP